MRFLQRTKRLGLPLGRSLRAYECLSRVQRVKVRGPARDCEQFAGHTVHCGAWRRFLSSL